MSIIVKSKVKELCGDINLGGDFVEALDRHVQDIMKKSIERAKANGRRTVMAKDI